MSAWGENDAKEAKEAVRAEWADRVLVTRSARPREARVARRLAPQDPVGGRAREHGHGEYF